ncbi:hypothetical protein AK812_SmicGene40256 [Symbiodinium microadriaticum]|uniref:Uncharacterized protein n=1 Tax=Symbiodinium microadriaticum TaxID=2951 RepID=A0A1Q9C964_SYMMI|nr:hypothetical protein AK812_SmicGene40256 [Symbiodinium microadriaticum]
MTIMTVLPIVWRTMQMVMLLTMGWITMAVIMLVVALLRQVMVTVEDSSEKTAVNEHGCSDGQEKATSTATAATSAEDVPPESQYALRQVSVDAAGLRASIVKGMQGRVQDRPLVSDTLDDAGFALD